MMLASLSTSVLLNLALINVIWALESCYYPDGRLIEADTPCDPEAPNHSMCCARGDICLSNNLCFVPNINHYHRGVCQPHSLTVFD